MNKESKLISNNDHVIITSTEYAELIAIKCSYDSLKKENTELKIKLAQSECALSLCEYDKGEQQHDKKPWYHIFK